MGKIGGRSVRLSPFRRLVTDLMYFSTQVPSVTIERRMDLSPLIAARRRIQPHPGWAVLFAKALALVARHRPELRRSYMAFPWARFYEHPYSLVALNVERFDGDEPVVVQCLIRRPENRPLLEMEKIVRYHQEEPLDKLRWYQRAVAMSKLPWPLRPLLWWGALNVFGRRRTHNFGTFGISSVASQGAGVLHAIPLLSSMLHYGLFEDSGHLTVRLTWDHRIMDGGPAARILVEVERTLLGELLDELTVRGNAAAA
jgi:hypothetical protein